MGRSDLRFSPATDRIAGREDIASCDRLVRARPPARERQSPERSL